MMQTEEFLKLFRRELILSLPGEKAHVKMAPIGRPVSSIALKMADKVRESAVAVVLYKNNGSIECILTQRPEYDGNHSGQVSFPGGKKDPSDLDLEETARRECFEEIGIPTDQGILLGQLTDVFIPVSSFLVKAYVIYHDVLPILKKDEREVSEILSFPLFDLKNEELISTMEIHLPNGTLYQNIPYFDLADKKVWGATALILSELREILLAIN
ncbi:MAG: NUDIX hydrolase [Flavobacteriia bacterium]|jgi:8-oxo-dGTP pyrophosphatase MutT (NUDIX family)